jgi:chromatin segregation and condensation protein Rec8/ScpA/Scc1 (kleisin family)
MADKAITIWSDPRWRVLFDVTRLDRVKPWQIKLVEILRTLMEELGRIGLIDLNSCGVAAYSAAAIHRMKTELLLKVDRPKLADDDLRKETMIAPPPIDLPCMPEFMVVAVGELIQALRDALSRPSQNNGSSEEKALLAVFDVELDEFLVKLEERLEEFLEGLRRIFGDKEMIDLKSIFEGVDRLEAARRLILLLFAAARGDVELIEDEEHKLIAVKWLLKGGKENF